MSRTYDIAVIPGDGIGKEVVPVGVRVLEAAAKKFGFELKQTWHDFASYDYYAKHERMMPEDWQERGQSESGEIYFESEDGTKGVYIATWNIPASQDNDSRTVAQSFRRAEVTSLKRRRRSRTWSLLWSRHSNRPLGRRPAERR